MHHSGHAPPKLRLHRNHEALAAYRNQFVLRGTLRRQRAQALAQALLDRAMLPLHRPPNAPQLMARIIAQCSIRFDLSAQRRQHQARIPLPHRPRQLRDRPLSTY